LVPGADADLDGLADIVETNTGTYVGPLDTGTDPADYDTDDDGCSDGEEIGGNVMAGGMRSPVHFWDFFDTPNASNVRDKAVASSDFFAVISRFGATGSPGIDPLSTPPVAPAYHPAFDRASSLPGSDQWDLEPADGSIAAADIFLSIAQFGHSCMAPP
jgi:hypothetical protein